MTTVKKTGIWFCNRCFIRNIDNNGNPTGRMCPCPRGGCEAEIVGICTTKKVVELFNVKETKT